MLIHPLFCISVSVSVTKGPSKEESNLLLMHPVFKINVYCATIANNYCCQWNIMYNLFKGRKRYIWVKFVIHAVLL